MLERVKRNWFLIVVALGTLLVVWSLYQRDKAFAEPADLQTHTVIGFSVTADYGSGTPIARTRDKDGNEFAARAYAEIGSECAVGDPILVEMRGVNASLPLNPCSQARSADGE